MPVLNLTNVKVSNFDAIDAGMYSLEVVEVLEEKAKTSGEPMLKVQLAVPMDAPAFGNRRLFDNMTYGEDSLWKLVQFLQALGYTEDELASIDTSDKDWRDNLVGQVVGAQVLVKNVTGTKEEQYGDSNGNKNVIKRYFAV